uniref:Uncharacterized protein n=1 Tax=Arundo donax TaxID=35708 RepID=A0A0A8YL12_ARUDO
MDSMSFHVRHQREMSCLLPGHAGHLKVPFSGLCRSAGAERNPSPRLSFQTASRLKLLILHKTLLLHLLPH